METLREIAPSLYIAALLFAVGALVYCKIDAYRNDKQMELINPQAGNPFTGIVCKYELARNGKLLGYVSITEEGAAIVVLVRQVSHASVYGFLYEEGYTVESIK